MAQSGERAVAGLLEGKTREEQVEHQQRQTRAGNIPPLEGEQRTIGATQGRNGAQTKNNDSFWGLQARTQWRTRSATCLTRGQETALDLTDQKGARTVNHPSLSPKLKIAERTDCQAHRA